jgi:NAD(P)-dependent dehydrogenase (short-subunit alcohol dehydrogenase family)
MGRLAGKSTLVTGGSSGIGFATAQRFLEEGARVVVTASTQASAERAARELGGDTLGIGADARSLAAQRDLAAAAAAHLGRLDVAFLNAGVSDFRPFELHDEESFDRLFDINVKSLFFLVQALGPVLADGASVVVNSSNVAHGGHAYASLYAATKAATSALMRSWNAELLGSRGIRFNAVSPGPVDTPLYDKPGSPFTDGAAAQAALAPDIPVGRFGRPREIADLVVHLASDESAYTVGQDIVADGGRHLS